MKKTVSLTLAVLMILVACLTTSCGKEIPKIASDPKYVIGICEAAEHTALSSATKGFMDALTEELGENYVKFIVKNAEKDGVDCDTIVADFVQQDVDMILGNATDALKAAAKATTTIPVLGTSVTDYGVALGIESVDGLVGTNVSGTSDLSPLSDHAAMIAELFPDAEKIGILYCKTDLSALYQVENIKIELEKKGFTCTGYSFTDENDVASAAERAAAESDVIYVSTDNTVTGCAEAIYSAAIAEKTPIFGGDAGICGDCAVATITVDYYTLGVTTGKMAAKILKGESKIAEMEISFAQAFPKYYNKTACEALGIDTALMEVAGFTALD